jgi:hypothetical protein
MHKDERDTDIDSALRRLFEETAGPAEPQTARRPTSRWLRRAPALAVSVTAASVLLYQFVSDPADSSSDSGTSSASCAAALEYRGHLYLGNRVSWSAETTGDRGQATATCGEDVRTVSVTHLAGISEDVAVTAPGEDGVVYIANGRCTGVSGDEAILDCLKTTLNVDGRAYIQTQIPGLATTTTLVGSGSLVGPNGQRTVDTHAAELNGAVLPASLALAVDGVIHVAIDACQEESSMELRGALRCH